MVKIKKIGVLSTAKLFGVLYVFIGLIGGIFMSLFGVIGLATTPEIPGIIGIVFGVGAIIFMPIIYGVMGFIGGAIMAWLYNLIASRVGGIEVETEK